MSKTRNLIIERQISWALSAGMVPDFRGYLESVEANLWCPLSEASRASFENGSGSELTTKMRALHSSSALAVNFFEHWVATDRKPLMQILELESPIASLDFEAQFPTGLKGNPPNLDVCLTLQSGGVVAIESKFCEWIDRKSSQKEYFKDKYFPNNASLWSLQGLPCCQKMAEAIHNRSEFFLHLDAPQLLKHALGLSTRYGSNFDLYYLYFDSVGPESDHHKKEIARFTEIVGEELRFKSLTYQELFLRLGNFHEVDLGYKNYLNKRYFEDLVE